jgi:prophage DNA circulation protein
MATLIEVSPAPWRLRLVPASFAGITFHVESQALSSGRRVVLHEYPKRDLPYAEDMGRHATRYQITGYLIGPNYNLFKAQLVRALQNTSTGAPYIDPYLASPLNVICERYSVTEVRERGGYCTFEMLFVEAGSAGNSLQQTNTGADLNQQAQDTGSSQATTLDNLTADEAQRTTV